MKKLEAIEKVQNSIKTVNSVIDEACRNPKFDAVSMKYVFSTLEKEYGVIASLEGKVKGFEREIEACRLKFTEIAGLVNQHKNVAYLNLDWSKIMPAYEKAAAAVRPEQVEMEK